MPVNLGDENAVGAIGLFTTHQPTGLKGFVAGPFTRSAYGIVCAFTPVTGPFADATPEGVTMLVKVLDLGDRPAAEADASSTAEATDGDV